MDYSFIIGRLVKYYLDAHPKMRCCGSCPCTCDDMTRFICLGNTINDLEKFKEENPNIANKIELEFYGEL